MAGRNTWAGWTACALVLACGGPGLVHEGRAQSEQRAQASQSQRPETGGATRRNLRPREKQATSEAKPVKPGKPAEAPKETPKESPAPTQAPAVPVQSEVKPGSKTPTQSEPTPTPRFMLRGASLRGVSLGHALEYAWWMKPKDVTLRSYSGGSEGLRVASLPVGDGTAKVPAGARIAAQALGAQDGEANHVSNEDIAAFEKLLPAAHDRAALHRMVLPDASAKWEIVFTLPAPLQDNLAQDDWMPELCVAFAAEGGGEGEVTIVALDAKGNETGTPVAVRAKDAAPTTPALAISLVDGEGKVQGTGEVRIATLDLSRLGVLSVQQLLVRSPRAGDKAPSGESVSGSSPRGGFKLMLLETAGMPLPAWAMGD